MQPEKRSAARLYFSTDNEVIIIRTEKEETRRLQRICLELEKRGYTFSFAEEDGVGSIDFQDRGLDYHIWEFCDEDGRCGAETNLMHAGRMEELTGDYEDQILDMLKIFVK